MGSRLSSILRSGALLCLAASFFAQASYALESEIKLSKKKNTILSLEARGKVLEVGESALLREPAVIVAGEMTNPFAFEVIPVAEEPIITEQGDVKVTVERAPRPIEIEESAVLERVAESFSQRIRGVIALGAKRYLQLDGGALIESGTSFPAKLPQFEGKTYTVTISEITSDGYVLVLGSSHLRRSLSANPSAAGSIRVSP